MRNPGRASEMRNGRGMAMMLMGGAAALVVFSITGPDFAPPLVLLAMGVATIAFPHATPETVRTHGAARARRIARGLGIVAVLLGAALLLGTLGVV